MTLKNKNSWKYLSVGLLGVIAIGLLAPVQAAPGGVGDSTIVDALNNISAAIMGIPDPTVDVTVPENAIQVDVVGVQGPTGDKGPDGDKGPVGDQGPSGTFNTYSVVETVIDSTLAVASVQCDLGDFATGGGGQAGNSRNDLIRDFPIDSNGDAVIDGEITTGWEALVGRGIDVNSAEAIAFVICLDNTPLRGLPPIVVIP